MLNCLRAGKTKSERITYTQVEDQVLAAPVFFKWLDRLEKASGVPGQGKRKGEVEAQHEDGGIDTQAGAGPNGYLFIKAVPAEFSSRRFFVFMKPPDVAGIHKEGPFKNPGNVETVFKAEFQLYFTGLVNIEAALQ
jgi:hypothetical protein